MNQKKKYLIFAHYHSKGLIRKDIVRFLYESKKIFTKIVFISTKIKSNQIKKLPKGIKMIRRKNVGYDFNSYKKGWEYVYKKFKLNYENRNLFFVNSSILFVNPHKILSLIKKTNIKKDEFWGISRSFELSDHVGTYFFFFCGELFQNKKILQWWKNIKPINDRNKVVSKYELGLSSLMRENNIKLMSFYKKNINLKTNNIFKKLKQRFEEIFFKTPKYYKKNPINYFWRDFYNQYGIIKVKLVHDNEEKYDTKGLRALLKNKNLLLESLNN